MEEIKSIQNKVENKHPCNIEAEQALLGSILVNNDIIDEISNTIKLLWKSLKRSSPFFMSFKYGENSYTKNERHFQNYTEVTVEPILDNLEEHKVEKIWTTADKRLNRKGENWLNLILTKV